MKKIFLFSLLILPVLTFSQMQVNQVDVNYSVLTDITTSSQNIIFDSLLISKAHYKKAIIRITDSSSANTFVKKKYSENMVFSFEKNGKLIKGEYALLHPDLKLNATIDYYYVSSSKVFIHSSQDVITVSNKSSLLSYTREGKFDYSKSWDEYGNGIPAKIEDTVNGNFNYHSEKYDEWGMKVFENTIIKGDENNTEQKIFFKYDNYRNPGDSVLVKAIETISAPDNYSDSATQIYLRDPSGKITDIFTGKRHEAWRYNSAGLLIEYFDDVPGKKVQQYIITRYEDGLPLKVVFANGEYAVRFDFTWE